MKNENGLNQLNNNLRNHKSFRLFYKNELFAKFDYNNELKRYQSDIGYLTMEKVYEIANNMEQDRKIVWIGD